MSNFKFIATSGAPIKAWVKGVPVEPEAEAQLRNMAGLPFIYKHVAVMPDVHLGKGATVGSVIPTKGAIVPAAVGVDIGCGMCAAMTDLVANDLPDSLAAVRKAIEKVIPVGQGSHKEVPKAAEKVWYGKLKEAFTAIDVKHPGLTTKASPAYQLGTLGGGNHFIELCLDEADRVWVMLHSGSRNVGNRIGSHFIAKAKEEMERMFIRLPDKDLAYLAEGSTLFDDYVEAVGWAQDYARVNRDLDAGRRDRGDRRGARPHHRPRRRGRELPPQLRRQGGAFRRARVGDAQGRGACRRRRARHHPGLDGGQVATSCAASATRTSFQTCSHGAGRAHVARRGQAPLHGRGPCAAPTEGVECRKDTGVIDETPAAYKDIDAVMAAQSDLVEVVHTLKQVLCVKG